MMKNIKFILVIAAIFMAIAKHGIAVESEASIIRCDKSALWSAAADSSDFRKYAPDREIDILHLVVDVTPDFKARTITGKAILRFVSIAKPLRELRLDAVDLTVSSLESSAEIADYQVTEEEIIVTFVEPIPPGVETTAMITYEAEPRKGLYFRTPDMGYREEDTHLWTIGQPHEACYWYPSFDYPNEKFTSEVICHVPEEMVVISNGRLISEKIDPATELKTVRWLQDKPHTNYLIALVAGKLKKIEDRYRDIPLAFYTPASQITQAENSFRDTADMMAYFEQEIGVPYPWSKYYQAVVDDFIAGGMENTTLTILTNETLFTDATENIHSSQRLVAHELAHQWFGDYVTCKDWSHLWLNEGFATYYALLYNGHKNGRSSMIYGLYQNAKRILDAEDDPRPAVHRTYDKVREQFGYRAYQKGGWVLHMLRTQLGEDLYRKCIKTYMERNAFQSVVTEDLNKVIEEISGNSFDQFFDQWVYHSRYPELEVSYSWDGISKLAKVTIKQTQKLSDQVLLFNFPAKIRFKTETDVIDEEIVVKEKQHDFYFALAEAPTTVRFDPDYGVLAKIKFTKPNAMLYAQLEDREDVMGRLMAIEALKSKKDKKTIEKLKTVLNDDPFYGVRVEASKALGEIHTDEAFDALSDSTHQSDARVRQQVVSDLGKFYREESLAQSREVLSSEKNPAILADAIRNLGKYHDDATRQIILEYLKSQSYRNTLADAAIQSIRSLDDPTYIAPLKEALTEREKEFTSRGFGSGLKALAYIARNQEKRDGIREFLAGYVNHKKRGIQADALSALGTLKDTKAISLVATFEDTRSNDWVRRAAEGALKSLRDAKKIPVELGDLRSEVLELKKESKELKEEIADLKKRFDAYEQKPAEEEPQNSTQEDSSAE